MTAVSLTLLRCVIASIACSVTILAGEIEKVSSSPVPLIDISPFLKPSTEEQRLQVAQRVRAACENIGFFAIRNHGVDDKTVENAWNATMDFFDLSLEEKMLSASESDIEYPYGYEQSEALSQGKAHDDSSSPSAQGLPDLKETFAIGPDNPASGMPQRRFPTNPATMEDAFGKYYSAMEELSMVLLRIFALALELPDEWFEDKMDHHMCALRVLNYPAVGKIKPLPGQLRAGAHTDYGALTILKSGGPGLQLTKDDKNADWVDVPYLVDAFVINLGDLMQRWTNDKWKSTLHRVIVPSDEGIAERRQSMAFFVNINGDSPVVPIESCVDSSNPPKYDIITAGEHLMAKHLASMGIEGDEPRTEL